MRAIQRLAGVVLDLGRRRWLESALLLGGFVASVGGPLGSGTMELDGSAATLTLAGIGFWPGTGLVVPGMVALQWTVEWTGWPAWDVLFWLSFSAIAAVVAARGRARRRPHGGAGDQGSGSPPGVWRTQV